MVERLHGMQEVSGSSPLFSTKKGKLVSELVSLFLFSPNLPVNCDIQRNTAFTLSVRHSSFFLLWYSPFLRELHLLSQSLYHFLTILIVLPSSALSTYTPAAHRLIFSSVSLCNTNALITFPFISVNIALLPSNLLSKHRIVIRS